MCKVTILLYAQCMCGPRDANYTDGFLVLKDWHDRLALDAEDVPLQRCTQARNQAFNSSRSNTLEFSRCNSVRVKTVRFDERPCFRCFAHQEMEKRTEMIKLLYAERKALTARFHASSRAKIKDVEFTKEMRQTIKMQQKHDGRVMEHENLRGGGGLRPVRLGRGGDVDTNWEEGLQKRLADQKAAKEEKNDSFEERKERLTSLRDRLAHANSHHQTADQPGDPEHADSSCSESPSTPAVSGTTSITTAQSPTVPNQNTAPVKYRTNNGVTVNETGTWVQALAHDTTPPGTDSAPYSPIPLTAAEAPEFRPFRQPPPTEPRMMRAPAAPRAMRECNSRLSTWQTPSRSATYRGYATYRGWTG